eukprot:TRINITY_DN90691_c0_g1_i1.p1 TRINITY_DN90691_c0_g1~~TRINITY_DN90691_c0_g1_i1.p1  ORF type:complete len:226 (-),score=46.79 TRINITY_DN90691_c0_g1_i1:184-861(-)
MGVHGSIAESPLMHYIDSEFQRVGKTKQRLYLHQLQQLKPPEDCLLDLRHIPTLWKLDDDRNGWVSCHELVGFAEFCNDRLRALGSLDFSSKIKAQCDVDLWDAISESKGEEHFADWVVLLVAQGEAPMFFDCSPQVPFMSRDAVMTLYELMLPYQISSHVDQQGFLDMLQQIGEHMDLMALMDESLDDWVPTEVVHRWVKRYIAAYASLFQRLNLEAPKEGGDE